EVPESGHEPFEEMLLSWQVEEALRRIGEQHRRVLVETYLRERPYAEVAAELGGPEGTIKSRVYYGLRALRNAMEEMGYDGRGMQGLARADRRPGARAPRSPRHR